MGSNGVSTMDTTADSLTMESTWAGATCQWTLGDRLGKQHKGPPDLLASGGFATFYHSSEDQYNPRSRKHFDSSYSARCQPVAEPALTVSINTPYYSRRQGRGDEYRPHIKTIKPDLPEEKPDRKKYLTGPIDPVGASHITGGIRAIKMSQDPGHMDLPTMPRLNRDAGMHATVDRGGEISLGGEFSRKVRSTRDGYYGTGRAGDMSQTCGCAGRPEDHPAMYKTPKDAPTFTRFVESCAPSPEVSHAERRRMWYERKAHAEKRQEQDMVRGLDDFDPTAPPKRLDVPDPEEDDPEAEAAAAAAAAAVKKKPSRKK